MPDNTFEQKARAIFLEALDQERPEEILGLIDRACGNDASLRQRVEALLRAKSEAVEFLAGAGDAQQSAVTVDHSGAYHSGQSIGRYKLLQEIGEGGFGTVWMAEQKEPVKRRVALKIIKLGMDTRQVIARFEAERQALALMDHPNIAKVLDAGATEAGRPYFVMEYIRGVPIVEYCNHEKLDTRARLNLFSQVCHAIQHAHQKGIIHRDIKPSNVLVTLHDGVPVPKVIDFGVAKATNSELTTKTLFTEHRQMVGTPVYMSPEQAEMSGLDIDTRSDIYSLGVLLYELLTGTTPFSQQELMAKGYAEMMRIIREVEPPKPSTRVSTLESTVSPAPDRRQLELTKLGTVLRGDLDWIVMKCLEKDRARRYETANGLAMDIRRHLQDEPVAAGPPSSGYRLRKFVRRNRAQVIAGSVVAAALIFGVIGTTTGMLRANRERARADGEAERATLAAAAETEAKLAAQENERRAVAEAERAERELARATEIKRLITEMLTSVSPEEARGADTTLLKGILDDAADRLAKGEVTDELISSDLHAVVGDVFRRLGLYPQGEEHLSLALKMREGSLGKDHPSALASMSNLAILYQEQGRHAEAESLSLQVLAILQREMGEEHPQTLSEMNNLALLYHDQGRYAEAEPLFLKVLEIEGRVLGKENRSTLGTITNLGFLYTSMGRYEDAATMLEKSLAAKRRILGLEDPWTVNAMSGLASVYMQQGRYDAAEQLHMEALEINRQILGDEHPNTLGSMTNLANLWATLTRYDEALQMHREILKIQVRVLGDEHPQTLGSITNLGVIYKTTKRYKEAAELFESNLPAFRRVLGPDHPWTLGCLTNLGIVYNDMGRHGDAAEKLETSLPIKRRVLGEQHPWTRNAMEALATAYEALGRNEDALPLRRELLDIQIAGAVAPAPTAETLNAAAWPLLTHEIEELRDPPRALAFARRACGAEDTAGGANLWRYLDTLALAQHQTGDTITAIETQKRAISLLPPAVDPAAERELRGRLAEFEAALRNTNKAQIDGNEDQQQETRQ